jgi:hypothetical protein
LRESYREAGKVKKPTLLNLSDWPHTAPSRIKRTIGFSASPRAFQASQSPFTLRHTRLTVSLLIAPPNTAESARRTRRGIGPGKIDARDQRIDTLGSPLVGPLCLALPLHCLAVRHVEPGARHRDFHPAEKAVVVAGKVYHRIRWRLNPRASHNTNRLAKR